MAMTNRLEKHFYFEHGYRQGAMSARCVSIEGRVEGTMKRGWQGRAFVRDKK